MVQRAKDRFWKAERRRSSRLKAESSKGKAEAILTI